MERKRKTTLPQKHKDDASRLRKSKVKREHFSNFITKYRNIKYPRLEFKTGELEAIIPTSKDAMEIIQKYTDWIHKKQDFILDCLESARNLKLAKRSQKKFRLIVTDIIQQYALDLNMQVNNVFYRTMRTKWASCSNKRNVTINTQMQLLPERYIKYIIYHEMLHLLERRHNDRFLKMISAKFKDYSKIERSLFAYWFLLNRLKQ